MESTNNFAAAPSNAGPIRQSRMALAAVALSIFAFIPPLGIAAVVLGHVSIRRIAASRGARRVDYRILADDSNGGRVDDGLAGTAPDGAGFPSRHPRAACLPGNGSEPNPRLEQRTGARGHGAGPRHSDGGHP